jgi:hypothetical protein
LLLAAEQNKGLNCRAKHLNLGGSRALALSLKMLPLQLWVRANCVEDIKKQFGV